MTSLIDDPLFQVKKFNVSAQIIRVETCDDNASPNNRPLTKVKLSLIQIKMLRRGVIKMPVATEHRPATRHLLLSKTFRAHRHRSIKTPRLRSIKSLVAARLRQVMLHHRLPLVTP